MECTNLYAGFIYASARLLHEHGQLVSINPRSFANGPYFRDFRQKLFALAPLHAVHVFGSRAKAFSSDKVLQENVILSAIKGPAPDQLDIWSSAAGEAASKVRTVPIERAIDPDDSSMILHLEISPEDTEIANLIRALPSSLTDLDIQVSTGRVVDFRAREGLRKSATADSVPLLYPQHLRDASITWPKHAKKADFFCPGTKYLSQLIPAGTYVLTKRFTSKEEKRRISAALLTTAKVRGSWYALENHLNYFHASGKPLDADLAIGLTAYLNSSLVDGYFRIYNGHTQVNATDLRVMPYPPASVLRDLGKILHHSSLTTPNVDAVVTKACRNLAETKTQGSPGRSPRTRRSTRAA